METEEMPIEEKYDKLYDYLALYNVASQAFNKEQDIADKWPVYQAKVMKQLMPSFMGPVVKLLKVVTPGRTFKKTIDQMMYTMQMEQPLADLELTWVSDREAAIRYKNCEMLRRVRDIVKKTDLDIDPREICETDIAMHMSAEHPTKEFGVDLACELEENGCTWIIKLK